MQQWIVAGALAVLVVVVVTLALVVLAGRRRLAVDLEDSRARADELRERLAALEAREAPATGTTAGSRTPPVAEYLITEVGVPAERTSAPEPGDRLPTRIEGRLFADIVLRESLVRVAAAAGGLRRALDPETRNRIRFEMRREVRRSRKHRRTELRDARRLLAEQQRDRLPPGRGTGTEDAA